MRHTGAGTAEQQGRLWSARAQDWADVQQYQTKPSWLAVIAEQGPLLGRDVLDVGCGAGGFAELAAASGARVSGIVRGADRPAPAGAVHRRPVTATWMQSGMGR